MTTTNPIKVICFDLDETLISHSSWKYLNMSLGISEEEDARMHKEYVEGKIGYDEWNDRILNLYLKRENATKEGITEILSQYSYNEGTREVVDYLKGKGYTLVLISGSIDILVSMVAHDLGIALFKANNTFVFDEKSRLQAIKSEGDDERAKLRYLESFCELLGADISECAAIGDGANDGLLFKATGHGITFRGSKLESDAWKTIEKLTDLKAVF